MDFWISVWISADGVRDFFRDGPLALTLLVDGHPLAIGHSCESILKTLDTDRRHFFSLPYIGFHTSVLKFHTTHLFNYTYIE